MCMCVVELVIENMKNYNTILFTLWWYNNIFSSKMHVEQKKQKINIMSEN